VGGLLAVTEINGTHFVAYDGNGNVTRLVKVSDSTVSGTYEYSPFGELIRVEGAAAKPNPFRFSTKYTDEETDLVYYGYRYYNASTGRWLSRDPLGELGGANLYGFLQNNGINDYDLHGLIAWGPILKFAKDCAVELLKAGLLNQFNKWWDGAQACEALNDHAAVNPLIDLCKGVDIDVDLSSSQRTTVWQRRFSAASGARQNQRVSTSC
jgi:RHS repeat-associated protein